MTAYCYLCNRFLKRGENGTERLKHEFDLDPTGDYPGEIWQHKQGNPKCGKMPKPEATNAVTE